MDDNDLRVGPDGKNDAPRPDASPKCALMLPSQRDDIAAERSALHLVEHPVDAASVAHRHALQRALGPVT